MAATRWKLVTGAFAVFAVLAATTACSNSSKDENEILVYNAQHESLTKEWADAFTKETGIKVTLRNGGDTDLANQLVAEGSNSPADVFLTENSPAMSLVENAGLFADLDPDTLAQVPEQYRPSTGKWTGIAARSTVFVYNKAKLPADRLPASLLDLAQPQWKGRWTAGTSGADFQAIVAALLELKGEDATRAWLKGMKDNAPASQNNTTAMKAVNTGQFDGAVIYHYYWYRDQAATKENSANTALHYFKNNDPGAFVSTSGGGVLKSSKKSAAAQKFVKFITGRAGQQVLHDGTSMEYPVAAGVPANPALPPLDSLQAPKLDPSKLDAKKVHQLMTEAGLL
ncbi:iron ABC transporter substrate-binding protein [Nocardia terpenica]|uniref:Iron ABC transporter substrate-binding protein n=1 Tax=Nocardia terpenica TaxID=455432 RepID=A0A164PST3_9NOCA|nr:iron ABC transporter substrate-binding protein [Nocardia terpenica]KZM76018.1 iron ABC transporter substrate-binding protein [Nocardia terpenica]MBF6061942.1 iron ABC transporter substrate-binding protein [Nocardia terpenica]MBF6106257.1 iron ABC transporter substrate-binding protein [Nocardia terpenica]MBF6110362.1 iron ABC transporter substrate-binding protein [Nocardia terpenica]MBF6120801.1 iron ABC transporter substrate-binding protein [Nocardia terpenica]